MSNGSSRKGSIAVLRGRGRFAQANGDILDKLGKMTSSFLVAKIYMIQFTTPFCSREPVFGDARGK
jgi:hypothetical protein